MSTLHQYIKSPNTSLNLISGLCGFLVPATLNYTFVVQGYSNYAGTGSGVKRIWDTAIKPLSYSEVLTSGTNYILNFSESNLPAALLYNIIVPVLINGTKYVYGFTNAPGNTAQVTSTGSVTSKIQYWIEPRVFGASNSLGSPNTAQNYCFASVPAQQGSGGNLVISFSEPTTSAMTCIVTCQFIGDSTPTVNSTSATETIPAGSLSYTSSFGFFSAAGDNFNSGTYRLNVTLSNTSDYQSVFPFYYMRAHT